MSPCWEALFTLVTVRKLRKDNSDYNPLLLDSGDIPSIKFFRNFKFYTSWFGRDDFLVNVANIWCKHVNSIDPTHTINIKLKRVKKLLKVGVPMCSVIIES
jgi:hypothetical protein